MSKDKVAWLLLLLLPSLASAARLHPESWYQERGCQGQVEYRLPDATRCDCLTQTHAIEYDFGTKWYEAVSQSLWYSLQTGKKAGIVLIIESDDEYKYWIRLNTLIDHFRLPIDTWIVRP